MKELLSLFASAAFLATPAAAQRAYYLPNLPVSVQLIPDPRSEFCGSTELVARLRQTFGVVGGPDELRYPDLRLSCDVYDAERVRFILRDVQDRAVDEFRAKVLADRSTYESTAYLVSRRLATGKKTIRAALAANLADASYQYRRTGVSAFDSGDWNTAAGLLYKGLASDAKTSILYFGLYGAHAKLGHAAQARWYLLEYCELEGKRPTDLGDERLAYLRGIAPPSDGTLPESADLTNWRALVAARNWSGAILELQELIEKAPWTVEAYDALANAYAAVGWNEFEQVWRRRAKLARKTAADETLQRNLLDALQGP